MEFTFHNSYVIVELVPRTVIFWTDLSCWRTSCSSKATMLLSWIKHRYKNSTVIITNWLTVTKYPYPKWQWIFTEILSFIFHCQGFYKTWLYIYIWTTRRCLIRSRNCLPFANICDHSRCCFLLVVLPFCVVLLCVFTLIVRCCDVRYTVKK
jgi:hypothetical protein